LKTVSVGFIPKERDPENQRIITRAELLEVSFVPVPCNPNALSL
jgi:phage head maturation protease